MIKILDHRNCVNTTGQKRTLVWRYGPSLLDDVKLGAQDLAKHLQRSFIGGNS